MTRVKITSSIYLLKLSSATNTRPKSVIMDQYQPPCDNDLAQLWSLDKTVATAATNAGFSLRQNYLKIFMQFIYMCYWIS